MKEKTVAESRTVMTEMIMPNDANPLGNLMGGYLMRWMDIAGGICASRHCEAHVVTVSVDHVSFKRPIKVGHVITITASVTRVFNTSLEVFIQVESGNPMRNERHLSNHAYFTFVALDDVTQRPLQIPRVVPETEDEQRLYESAIRRRELRLVLAGRLEVDDAHEIKSLFRDAKA
ncbi:MAG: acyl-CoA thioesterase [Saprospiraceae bacterium]|nr:acyl-CoA thioesterase [Saprospiraceae bacterium]